MVLLCRRSGSGGMEGERDGTCSLNKSFTPLPPVFVLAMAVTCSSPLGLDRVYWRRLTADNDWVCRYGGSGSGNWSCI